MARFSAFSRGRIVGKAEEGAPRKKIRASVLKTDGTPSSLRAIDKVLAHSRSIPSGTATTPKAVLCQTAADLHPAVHRWHGECNNGLVGAWKNGALGNRSRNSYRHVWLWRRVFWGLAGTVPRMERTLLVFRTDRDCAHNS